MVFSGRILSAFIWAGVIAPALAQAGEPLEKRAQQILSVNCEACHGQARMSGLDIRDIGGILRGGKRGPSVVPGNGSTSLLYQAISQTGDLKMPPGKTPLSRADVETVRQWIDTGAKWPATAVNSKEPAWWAFRTPRRPGLPEVGNKSWVRTPVDGFILRKLEDQRLKPAPPAGKATLIRRVTYDLTGLPPSPAEVAAFLGDPSPDSYEKLVERLLASKQYGERWGRHWLDVVRYADSTGHESDLFYRNAWRYRDYVIQSFNSNKSYDRFVQEQIAADEIWPDDNELAGLYILPKKKAENLERRIGTGMYTVGPLDPSSGLDGAQLRYEQLTDMADTTGAA
ncbi:MAG TPA: DUF1549 domain-containing protein, partial [Bryobacteraceae bacterium]|nr:DUF1549 domain-containing protein [Bryobacteraceae bacterium]